MAWGLRSAKPRRRTLQTSCMKGVPRTRDARGPRETKLWTLLRTSQTGHALEGTRMYSKPLFQTLVTGLRSVETELSAASIVEEEPNGLWFCTPLG
ncbi:hypothetical protein E4U54_004413, partial [Claviceps lovelessii]